MVKGDSLGEAMFYGRGAGKLPTASAVVADVIDCVKHFKARKYLYWDDSKENYVAPFEEESFEYYVRLKYFTTETAEKLANKYFGKIRKLSRENQPEGEIAFVTSFIKESDMKAFSKEAQSEGADILGVIRLSDY